MYKKYLVRESDKFDPQQFLFITDDIAIIRDQTEHTPSLFKAEIIVGFMKNHSLDNEWMNLNPQLTELVTSGSLSSRNIEALFESCVNNHTFRQQLEDFLKKGFSDKSLA